MCKARKFQFLRILIMAFDQYLKAQPEHLSVLCVGFVHDSAIKDKLQCASREHVSRVKAPNVMPLLELHFKKLMNH
jgi:hypothetical protein